MNNTASAQGSTRIVAFTAVCVTALLASGLFYYQKSADFVESQIREELLLTANLRASLIASWRSERLGDGNVAANDPHLINAIAAPTAENQATTRQYMDSLLGTYNYTAAFLVDPDGRLLQRFGTAGETLASDTTLQLREAARQRLTLLADSAPPGNSTAHTLDVVAPLFIRSKDSPRLFGGLILRIDPQLHLSPLLDSTTISHIKGETYLVHPDGGNAVYVVPPRSADSIKHFSIPLSFTKSVAVQAALGTVGPCDGVDYRGVDVLGAVVPVPNSRWRLVVKIARADALAVVRSRTNSVLLGTFGFAFTAAAVGAMAWQRNRHRFREAAAATLQQAIFASADVAIVSTDIHGNVTSFSPGAERLYGYRAAEMLGWQSTSVLHDPTAVASRAEELGRELGRPIQPGLETFVAKPLLHGSEEREWTCLRKDGSRVPVLLRFTVLRDPDNAVTGYLGVAVDITERKRSEEELRSSLRETGNLKAALDEHAIVAITDPRGRIIYVNDKFTQISKYPREELIGEDHRILNSAHHPKTFFKDLWSTIARGRVWKGEICNRAKDGTHYWVDTTIVPFLGADGKPTQYVAIRADITERKHLEDSLARARDQAIEASRLKSEFLANMSHEIRTPMNGVIGMSGLLMDTPLDDQQREMARIITGSAENLLGIINDILDFSKIEAGKLRIDPVEFEPRPIFDETLALLAAKAHEKKLELLLDFDDRLDTPLIGDAGRIRQMLTNLVGNALKFTETGEVLVGVRWLESAAPGSVRFRVCVRDTGIGISPDAQRRLFQPFSQADGSTTRFYGGTGLGLAITRQLVEHMNGRIGLTSKVGEGSEFWFELELPRAPGSVAAKLPPLPPGTRILAVDDNAANRRILTSQIAAMGAAADTVGNSQAALAKLSAARQSGQPYHAILLDWNLPGMDGLELARTIHADPANRDLPLIMLSSIGPQALVDGSAAGEFTAHLTKPVRKESLYRVLSRLSFTPSPPAATAPTTPPSPTALAQAPASTAHCRLLLAEDNPANQLVARLLLEKLGVAVDIANNGREALAKLSVGTYDALLLDCQMPVLDGYETARLIRAGTEPGVAPHIPIIALTAHARADDQQRCLAAGMDEYLTKPVRIAELQAVLAKLHRDPSSPPPTPAPPGPDTLDAVLDPDQLALLGDLPGQHGPSLLPEIIEIFRTSQTARLDELDRIASAQDASELERAAHTFAGSCANLGALPLRDTALALEAAAARGEWPAVPSLLATLRIQYGHVCAALAKLNPPAP